MANAGFPTHSLFFLSENAGTLEPKKGVPERKPSEGGKKGHLKSPTWDKHGSPEISHTSILDTLVWSQFEYRIPVLGILDRPSQVTRPNPPQLFLLCLTLEIHSKWWPRRIFRVEVESIIFQGAWSDSWRICCKDAPFLSSGFLSGTRITLRTTNRSRFCLALLCQMAGQLRCPFSLDPRATS